VAHLTNPNLNIEAKQAASELAGCVRDAQDGVTLMRDADQRMKQAHDQWIEGALKTAGALQAARQRLRKDDYEFGQWCDANGLGGAVLSKDDRAALIRIGADPAYWHKVLSETESRSLRLITRQHMSTVSQPAKPPSAPQAEPVRGARIADAEPKAVHARSITRSADDEPEPVRIVSITRRADDEPELRSERLDPELARALDLIIKVENYGRFTDEAGLAALAHMTNGAGRNHAAIRRVVEAITDALDANAGLVTLSKVERRIAERRT
jgi:hypothetical protein